MYPNIIIYHLRTGINDFDKCNKNFQKRQVRSRLIFDINIHYLGTKKKHTYFGSRHLSRMSLPTPPKSTRCPDDPSSVPPARRGAHLCYATDPVLHGKRTGHTCDGRPDFTVFLRIIAPSEISRYHARTV